MDGSAASALVPRSGFATNGLVELLNVPRLDDTFVAIERSFSFGIPGTGNSIRLFLTTLDSATNLNGIADLDDADSYAGMSKTLLFDPGTLTNIDASAVAEDNIEGITRGPQVNGFDTLILVSDNNFSPTQSTQFLAFSVQPVLVPAVLVSEQRRPCTVVKQRSPY